MHSADNSYLSGTTDLTTITIDNIPSFVSMRYDTHTIYWMNINQIDTRVWFEIATGNKSFHKIHRVQSYYLKMRSDKNKRFLERKKTPLFARNTYFSAIHAYSLLWFNELYDTQWCNEERYVRFDIHHGNVLWENEVFSRDWKVR